MEDKLIKKLFWKNPILIMLDLNKDELHALHRYIVETKFSPNAEDIAFAKFIGQIANKVLDKIIADTEKNDNDKAIRWKSWRLLTKTRPEWGMIKERIKQDNYWDEFSTEQKINHLKIIGSLYIIPDNLLNEVINDRFAD